MLFSYNWLKEYIEGKVPEPKKLAELLTMHSFEVSEVKPVGKDWILDIDVSPNRADCLSHIGLSREIAAITDQKFTRLRESSIPLRESASSCKDFLKVEVKAKDLCPRYTAKVITDVKVGASPKWMRERLKVCGIRPINNIVDITNYVMLEFGQPLHAFDYDKVKGKKIIVRRAKKGESITTLDGVKHGLDESMLVIADIQKPIAIAGVMGGANTEVDQKTKTVILESANFVRPSIYKTSKRLNLKTESSMRFGQEIAPVLASQAVGRAAKLAQEVLGAKILQGLIDIYPKKLAPTRIRLDLDYVERLLGVKIPKKEIKNILKRLDMKMVDLGNRSMMVEVPASRLDLSLPEDLIEEIARIYDYEKIPASFPMGILIPPKRNLEIFWENSAVNILKEAGLTEIYNYSFISEKEAEIFKYSDKDLIEIENPISAEQKYLRPSLIPNLLKNVRTNFKYLPARAFGSGQWQAGFDEIRIFEIGKIFQKIIKKSSPLKFREKRMLSGIFAFKKAEIEPFYQLKGIIDLLLRKLGISKIWYDQYQPTPEESKIETWHPKKCAEIKINGEEIGFMGEISPKIIDALEIKGKLVLFDIDFEELLRYCSEEHEYRPISKYPTAIRDLAVVVPQGILVEDVMNKIHDAGGPLIRDIDLFDIYGGEEIPPEKKNLAFHIIFQAPDRTLKAAELDSLMEKIIKALEEDPEWEVRK